ncbi:hypothetical protein [Lactococcus formosensis]|uniref:hypothetical protein n=1 Tax=Lactococcus formosensis TaxID=1281486 RepID=UPI0031FE9F4C
MTEEIGLAMEIGIKSINLIGKSFDEVEGIAELTNVLKDLGFEDKGERKLGGDDKGIDYNRERCEGYGCTDPETKNTKHRCLGGIYIFSITNNNDDEINLKSFTDLWEKRKIKTTPKINAESSKKYLYVGKDVNNINTRISSHFGKSKKGNYALKLADEDIKNKMSNYNITCHRFTLNNNFSKCVRAGYIAMVEMILHEKLKPILGKK